ncbi:helix-turn-helix domain-containing protein [Streptomyces polygonati]|uniref:Helix-turn-helix domain-containing protein n=1 Tax=Streptomyces polygonati TaxID=1617087 RepID=A0ABV8HNZ3_9ACTN
MRVSAAPLHEETPVPVQHTDPRATLRSGLPDPYLTPDDLSALLSVPVETLYQWHKKRTGPPGFRVGKHLRYDPRAAHARISEQSTAA